MSTQAVLPTEAIDLIARRFAALSEPTRLRLLHVLCGGEKSVGALVEESGSTKANVSRHLQILASSHLVERRKEGLHVYYSIADPTVFKLCDLVCGSLGRQLSRQSKVFALRQSFMRPPSLV